MLPFQCNFCDKVFSQRHHLSIHKQSHTGEKSFKCNFCMKAFSQNADLINYKISHRGENQLKYIYCDKAFSQKYYFSTHIQHHTG